MIYRDLDTLQPGERFLIPSLGRKGTLLYCSPSSARVKYDGQAKEETIRTRWGETVRFQKVVSSEENISLKTQVVRLIKRGGGNGQRPMDG